MLVHNRLQRPVVFSAAVVIGLMCTSATKAGTWTVEPGGAFTAKAGETVLKDTSTGTAVRCTSADAEGVLKSGSGISGQYLGGFKKPFTFNGCIGPLGLSIKLKVTTQQHLVSLNYNGANNTVQLAITRVHIELSTSNCTAVIDGSSATRDDGKFVSTYCNADAEL